MSGEKGDCDLVKLVVMCAVGETHKSSSACGPCVTNGGSSREKKHERSVARLHVSNEGLQEFGVDLGLEPGGWL